MTGLTVPALQAMKVEGRKIVGVVAWDTPTASILDRAGVDLVSVGDSAAVHLWGREREGDLTLDEMVLLCAAVRRGVRRALVSSDLPPTSSNADAARRLAEEAGAALVKVEGEDAVAAIAATGMPVFAQLDGSSGNVKELVAAAKRLERAGASLLDFRHSGPEAGRAVTAAVSIPVVGGLGGGPWLDGRIRMIQRVIGYGQSATDAYADVCAITRDAVAAYAADVRAGRDVRGG